MFVKETRFGDVLHFGNHRMALSIRSRTELYLCPNRILAHIRHVFPKFPICWKPGVVSIFPIGPRKALLSAPRQFCSYCNEMSYCVSMSLRSYVDPSVADELNWPFRSLRSDCMRLRHLRISWEVSKGRAEVYIINWSCNICHATHTLIIR